MPNLYLALGALVAMIGAFFYGQHVDSAVWEAKWNAKNLATETAARDKDNEIARLARDLDSANGRETNAINKAADAARDAARARGLYVKARAGCDLPGTSAGASGGEGGTSEVRLSDETSDWLIAFAADADKAALYARTCHDWAVKVGRP